MSVKQPHGRRKNYTKILLFEYLPSETQQSSKILEQDETNLYTQYKT